MSAKKRTKQEILNEKMRKQKERELEIKEKQEERKRKSEEEKQRKLEESMERKRKLEEEKQKKQEERKRKTEEEKQRKLDEANERKRKQEEEKQRKQEELNEKKRKIEEEKQRKSEEKQKALEEELRKTSKQRITNFFPKKTSEESDHKNVVSDTIETFGNQRFRPFQCTANQTLAPIVSEFAKKRFNREVLDRLIESQNWTQLYLSSLKSLDYKSFRRNNREKNEPEVIIESSDDTNENQPKRYRIKYLQFHQNVRPPYRGTFRKTSRAIKAIKPFSKDSDLFDYEVDSDEEWEEGGPGESLNGSNSDGSAKDDYEIDNDFLVPHGYLSEDENEQNEEQMNVSVQNDSERTDPKEPKSGPLLKEQVLMAERNRMFSKCLTPVLMGCVWESNANNNQKFIECLQWFKRTAIHTK